MMDFSHDWFLYLVIAGNVAFVLVMLFVTISEAMKPAQQDRQP